MTVLVIHDDGSASVRRLTALLADRIPEIEIRIVSSPEEARTATADADALLLPPDALAELSSSASEPDQRRLLAVGRLAGGVAHDFNNALTGIMGYAALAEEELPAGDPVRAMMAQIIRGAERAASLARQLLEFARRQPLQPQEVDLNAVIGGVGRMLRRVLRENVDLALDRDRDLGFCHLDLTRLEQVLVHLVVDAGECYPEGGRVVVMTRNVDADREAPARIRLTVRGEGAEPAPRPDGGLGLVIAREIVERSGGLLTADIVDGAPRYRADFPRWDGEAAPDAPETQAPAGETILLVDDEELVLNMAGQVLESAGYRVLAAPGVERAIEIAREHEAPIHLLLTDVVMPVMNGPRLARKLRALRPDLRVLYMSGYAADALARDGGLKDEDVLLEKPFAPSRLTQVIREILEG